MTILDLEHLTLSRPRERLTCGACSRDFWREEMRPATGHYGMQIEHPRLVGACPHCGVDGHVS